MFYVTKKVDSHHFMVKDTYDDAVEMYSDEQLYNVVKHGVVRVLGVHYKVSKEGIEAYIVVPNSKSGALEDADCFDDYARNVLTNQLKVLGVRFYESDCIFNDSSLTVAIPFICGESARKVNEYGAWVLVNKGFERQVMIGTRRCAKEEGIKIEIYPGEKGYTYFRFDV